MKKYIKKGGDVPVRPANAAYSSSYYTPPSVHDPTLSTDTTYISKSERPDGFLWTDADIINAFDQCEATHWDPATINDQYYTDPPIANTSTSDSITNLIQCVVQTLRPGTSPLSNPAGTIAASYADGGPCTTAQGIRGPCDATMYSNPLYMDGSYKDHYSTDATGSKIYTDAVSYDINPGFQYYGGLRKNPRSTKNKKKVTSRMAKRSRTHRRKASRKSRRSTRRSRR